MLKMKFTSENENALTKSVLIEKIYTSENDKHWFDRMKAMDKVGILDELRDYANNIK